MIINITNLRSNPLSLDVAFEPGAGPQARILRANLGPGQTVNAAAAPVFATLEEVNRDADLSALRANGSISVVVVEQATDNLSVEAQFNKLRNDVVQAFVAAVEGGATDATVPYHKANPASITTEGNPVAAALPAVIVLANSLRAKIIAHLASAGDVGAHITASAATVTAAVAVDQVTANTLLNQEKARWNTHLGEAGVHMVADAMNAVAAADAVDLASSIALANELRGDFNAHIAAANVLDSLPLGSN